MLRSIAPGGGVEGDRVKRSLRSKTAGK